AVRQGAEWIVVDAPPTNRSRAGLAFVSQADAVVLAVKADETPAAAVAELRRDVELHGGKVLGVVLNGVKNDAWICSRLFGPQKSG
ncbi:MAG: sugar kinase, partial [Parvularculaceae bacterium]